MATAAAAATSPAALAAAAKLSSPARAGRVLLFDGVCNLCNKGIQFIAKRDPNRNVMFCSIQSQAAEPYLHAIGLTRQEALRHLVFVEYKDVSLGSTAALRVSGYMRPPWPAMKYLLGVPEPIREAVYNTVAANRYRMFGRTRTCQVPPIDMLDRFVDRDELMTGTCRQEGLEEEDKKD